MMTSRIDTSATLGVDGIAKSILVLRDQNVLLDRDLAALYGVTTKRLNEQVKRNLARFPIDFMFQLTAEEETALRSHFATSKNPAPNRGGRRYLPYAFTEQGVAMLSSVLSTERAVALIGTMAACETRANASERPPTYYTALQAHLTGWHWPAIAGDGAGDGNRTHTGGASGSRKQAVWRAGDSQV
jgi:ORF6N domain